MSSSSGQSLINPTLDFPNPPLNLQIIDGPHSQSLTLSWDIPQGATLPLSEVHNRPVTSYVVQGRNNDGRDLEYRDLVTVSSVRTTVTTVTGLHPGSLYSIRVLACNSAGSTSSQVMNATTNSSGESCSYVYSDFQFCPVRGFYSHNLA